MNSLCKFVMQMLRVYFVAPSLPRHLIAQLLSLSTRELFGAGWPDEGGEGGKEETDGCCISTPIFVPVDRIYCDGVEAVVLLVELTAMAANPP